ncbi:hypothetical protein O0L34_g11779 [Tuta absoluta]|nr:hypothetical protein O0L34_g11779 [Tuta absoluta]
MRSVYTFNRSSAETTAALTRVFSSGGTAREQLSLHAEIHIEPVGWDALWKLSKDFCKKFEVRFPCVAYVTVTSVDFEALSACVEVTSVQHELVSLPETVLDVPLIELWPTMKQQEQCVDAASTAEFIDLMRFFYNHIWMPWDEQDDKMLLPNTIEERMQLYIELHDGTIPNHVARTITLLRNSAIDAHERLQVLDSSLCEDSGDEDDSMLPANYITLCAELTAKLDTHLAKWTLYEKGLIRKQYLTKENAKCQKIKNRRNVVGLWQGGTATDFSHISKQLTDHHLSPDHHLTITTSADDGLTLEPEKLVICSKEYEIPEMPLANISISSINGATLRSSDMRSCLLNLHSKCSLHGLKLQCSRVNTAVVVRGGALHVDNCALCDDEQSEQSDFVQGIVAMADSKLLIENTTFENFYSGIVVHKGARVELRNCKIRNCGVGIQMYSGAAVSLSDTTVTSCAEHCIRAELNNDEHSNSVEGLHIEPNCTIGSGDLQKEVLIVKQDIDLY